MPFVFGVLPSASREDARRAVADFETLLAGLKVDSRADVQRFREEAARLRDETCIAMLHELPTLPPTLQGMLCLALAAHLGKTRALGIRWTELHDAIDRLPARVAHGLGWSLRRYLDVDRAALAEWSADASLEGVLAVLAFRSDAMRREVVLTFARSAACTSEARRAVCAVWPAAACVFRIESGPRV